MSKRYSLFITVFFCAFISLFFTANLLAPDRDFSPLENRVLQQLPTLTKHSFALGLGGTPGSFFSGAFMSDFETYVTDQFVGRDGWIAAKAALEAASGKQENNGIYLGSENTLIPRFAPPDEALVQKNLNYVNQLAENATVPVTFGLIPGKVSVWADRLPPHAPNADERALIARARTSTAAQWADVESPLTAHRSEDIYYRLDHHWTSLGAYYGYAAAMEAMGLVPVPLERYEKTTVSTNFSGTSFSTSGVRWMPPDSIERYVPDDGITVESWFGPQPMEGRLYHPAKLEGKDQYTYFMGGNQSLSVIRTGHADLPKLLVVRDSYADSMAPFLTPHFSELHLFDPRYNRTPLSQYIAENGIDQVLVLYSVANFVTDSNLYVLGQ